MSRNRGKSNKRWIFPVAAGVGSYLLLLILLLEAEKNHPDASIVTLTDAFWYSIVTMSTVGYGDLYPVSELGRLLGVAFVLLSVGVLTFVIGTLVTLLTGNILPSLQRWLNRDRTWYVFSCVSESVEALIRDLAGTDPETVFLIPKGEEKKLSGDIKTLSYPGSPEQVCAEKKDRCSLFFMDETSGTEYEKALSALSLGHPVYCLTEYAPDNCLGQLVLFNQYDCCAREYWRRNGLQKGEKNIVIIGSGKYARRLLTRALLTNLYSRDQKIRYHMFGDWENFRRNHHRLSDRFTINGTALEKDSLFFHEQPWNHDSTLLREAHRIIICHDDARENLRTLRHLRQYFPTNAQIHLRSERPVPEEQVFGTNELIYTAELVMRSGLTYAARAMHQIYSEGNPGIAGWEELSEFSRQSNIAAAEHLLIKIRILLDDPNIRRVSAETCAKAFQKYQETREQNAEAYRWLEHERWMRFHTLYNWEYAPVRNNSARQHPLMLPFEQLTLKDQEKDDYSWELLNKLSHCENLG